jgi:ribosomal protein S18 acetylase RimI-like enzyme
MNDQLRLGPAGQEDLAVIERLTGDPDAAGEHGWHGWLPPGRFRRGWEENGLLTDDHGTLMVLRGGERLGFVSWRRQQTARTSFCWNIGVAMLPEVRGLGYGTEAQRLLVDYLFAHTQVNRVEAMTEVTNTAEQWALEKAGFTREGVLRGYGFRDGQWRDAVVYSVLREEARGKSKEPGGEAVPRHHPSRRAPVGSQRDG